VRTQKKRKNPTKNSNKKEKNPTKTNKQKHNTLFLFDPSVHPSKIKKGGLFLFLSGFSFILFFLFFSRVFIHIHVYVGFIK